jgi:hypothetical protein
LIKATLGTTWGQRPLWVQTGYKKTQNILNIRGERVCHVATPEYAKSAGMCHVAHIYWATSAHVGPTPVKSAKKWAPPVCHVAVGDKTTSAGPAT